VLFFASAGASSAYLTVSEVFPMETRALAIAFFYAIGTAAGGISGPLLFSALVSTGKVSDTVIAFSIGATLMVLAGLVELFLGVKAERQSLEDIARPLTEEDADPTEARAGSAR
jgi:MFS family permease